MKRMFVVSIALVGSTLALTAAPRPDVTRTVYFSAVDAKGAPVADLTAADVTVKEGGKAYPVTGLQPAADPLWVSILVDDGGTGAFAPAVAQFIQATFGKAQYAISVLNPQPMKLTDFTGDADALRASLGKLGQRGKIPNDPEQIIAAVADAARDLQKHKGRRAIVVLSAVGEKPQADQADEALNNLKSSGASLNVLYINGLDLGRVLGDGPKQSGGIVQPASANVTLGPVLAKIADNLLHQYAVTYTIPDGVKLNEKLSLTTTRKGVTLFAPSKLPEK
jgi:hypothetical protein